MDAVNISVSGYCWTNEVPGTVKPTGNGAIAPVEWGAALTLVTYMVASRFNSGIRVVELDESRMAIVHDNNLTHMLPGFPRCTGRDFGWLYVVSHYSATDYPGALGVIFDSLFAQCVTYRDICSPKVASEVEKRVSDAGAREVENYRHALGYYAEDGMWVNRTLTGLVFDGHPGVVASDALRGKDIPPLQDAIARVPDRRRLPVALQQK